MKLHLGCGNRNIQGFINVDSRLDVNSDLVDDPTWLSRFDEGSVELIYASDVLDKVARPRVASTLRRWFAVLESGGTLRLSVPDVGVVARLHHETGVPMKELNASLYGTDVDRPNRTGFDFSLLKSDLQGAGFIDVQTWDWKRTEHADVPDSSQASLSWRGSPIETSLNLEARKP